MHGTKKTISKNNCNPIISIPDPSFEMDALGRKATCTATFGCKLSPRLQNHIFVAKVTQAMSSCLTGI